MSPPNYLNPDIPEKTKKVEIPLIEATCENLKGYGLLVDNPDDFKIEIVRWPQQGWRPIDQDSGDEGGVTHGTFISEWKGDVLYGRNSAVAGHYIIGYSKDPSEAEENHQNKPTELMLWHCNYHPDGGQLFYPKDKRPFVVPLALPGDDVKPSDFKCFCFKGNKGLYIHPNIWHEGVFTLEGTQKFIDKQGAVHARVSINFPKEFGCLLSMDLKKLG